MYVYIHMYMYTCIYIHMYIYIYICIYMQIYTYTCMYICVYLYAIKICIYTHIHRNQKLQAQDHTQKAYARKHE